MIDDLMVGPGREPDLTPTELNQEIPLHEAMGTLIEALQFAAGYASPHTVVDASVDGEGKILVSLARERNLKTGRPQSFIIRLSPASYAIPPAL